jgi:hypothetical protein
MFRPWTQSGIEKLLCQSFPVHELKLAHLTNADSWVGIECDICWPAEF